MLFLHSFAFLYLLIAAQLKLSLILYLPKHFSIALKAQQACIGVFLAIRFAARDTFQGLIFFFRFQAFSLLGHSQQALRNSYLLALLNCQLLAWQYPS